MDAKDSVLFLVLLLLSLGLFGGLSLTYCVWNKQTEVASELQSELHELQKKSEIADIRNEQCSKLQSELVDVQNELHELQNELKDTNSRVHLGASESSQDKGQLKRNVRQADDDPDSLSATEILTNALAEIIERKLVSFMDCDKNEYNHTQCTLKPGPKGEPGPEGEKGTKGEIGDKGQRGEPGDKGAKGNVVYPGYKGEKGRKGVAGPQGPPGPAGPQGPHGLQGETGERGEMGQRGSQYRRVCGRALAYQFVENYAFYEYHAYRQGIDRYDMDGLSLTHGASGSRQYIWTFASGLFTGNHNSTHPTFRCPCDNGNTKPSPPFVGDDYFCESVTQSGWATALYPNALLWDGQVCEGGGTCCQFNNPPWFTKNLANSTIEDIELRLCLWHSRNIADIALEQLELYVQ